MQSQVAGVRVRGPLDSCPFRINHRNVESSIMAGHSKWANIQHRKNRQDNKRGSLWTKIIREVTVASRDGGPDPAMNPRLRLALDKARLGNVPKDKLTSAIQRGAGKLEGASYEEIRYEGYGIGGAALMIDCMTDNRTRTVAEVRHALVQEWRKSRDRRFGGVQLQALRPVRVRTGHVGRKGDGRRARGRRRGCGQQRRRHDRSHHRAGRLRVRARSARHGRG